MRHLPIIICLTITAGCGSNSSETQPTAGVPLSINNPTAPKSSANASLTSPMVQELMTKAQRAVTSGQQKAAIEALSQAIGFDPRNSELFRLRADVYALMGENANARADYSLAIEADSGNAKLYNVRGYFLMTHGVNEEAVQDFNKAIELDPDFPEPVNNRGLVHLSEQEFQKAKADFAKAVTISDQYADGFNNLGFAEMKTGNLTAALTNLQRAVQINPKYTTAWNNCGLVYMKQEQYESAVQAFTKAVDIAPLDLRWIAQRRTAYLKMENFEQATADARRIQWLSVLDQLTRDATSNTGSAVAWLARAQHLIAGAEFEAAIADFGRVIELEPANTEALNGRALALINSGETRKAIDDCDVSLVTAPSTEAYSIRGDGWFALQNFDQAIQDFEAAQRFDESVAEAYRKRAEQHAQDGNQDLATKDRQRAHQIEAALAGELPNAAANRKPLPFPED